MARLPRYITPGQPQHIIQRGNNRQVIFAAEADYQFFRDAVVEAAGRFGLGKMVSDPIYSLLYLLSIYSLVSKLWKNEWI